MEGMKIAATPKKNTDVLMHIMGYFKKDLSGDEKKELLEIIERYRTGLIPLSRTITLLNHYVRKYSPEYLMKPVLSRPSSGRTDAPEPRLILKFSMSSPLQGSSCGLCVPPFIHMSSSLYPSDITIAPVKRPMKP